MSVELEKIKFHIQMLGECIDSTTSPIASLVISMDWDGDDLNRAHDIFEKYDNDLENGREVNWTQFEHEIRDEFEIGYQNVKSIVLAFYRNHQWVEVCKQYASDKPCMEFHEIINDR